MGWINIDEIYPRTPRQYIVTGAVHESRDEELVVEEHADEYVMFVVEKQDPDNVLYEVERHISEDEIESKADEWVDEHPNGLADV